MGLLNSVNLANGLSQAGKSVGQVGEDWGKSILEQEKIKLADQLASAREATGDYRRASLNEEAAKKAAERAPIVAGATEKARLQAGIEMAPKLTEVEVDRQTKIAAANTQAKIAEFEKMAPLERQKKIDEARALAELYNDPKILAALHKKAAAEHIVTPQFSFMPMADGTIAGFDVHTGKSTGVLKDKDGKPLEVRDPTQVAAASKLLDNANAELRIGEAAYASKKNSLDPEEKARAEADWKVLQERVRSDKATALAVMTGKARAGDAMIPGAGGPAAAPSITDPFAAKPGTKPAAAASGRLTPEQVAERNAEIQRMNSMVRDPNADANATARQAAAAAVAEQRKKQMEENAKVAGFINSRLAR